ncbi:MAG: HipA domain-containing protein [Gemmatimonadetes bacterium]|nr:HipA domain-containing protein [Gemmatimonadota bacterium]
MSPGPRSRRLDTTRPRLDVYLCGRLVGHVGQEGPDTWFRYTEAAVAHAGTTDLRLSIRLPVRPDTYGHAETLAFFDNLLLEAGTREAIAALSQHDQRDVTGLLGEVGGECAGAVTLWPHGTEPPASPAYRPLPDDSLAALFDTTHGVALTRAQLESRQSLSGVQDKLVVRRTPAGWDLPLQCAPGDVILKRPSPRYPGLVENEYACQALAAAIGIEVPPTEALRGPGLALLASTRYDRRPDGAGGLRRLHQEDFCQATGRIPAHKYQRDRGPGFADLARVIRQECAAPARDLQRLLHRLVLNLCLGNMDAHAKNVALLYGDDGLALAPAYDLVCTLAYPALSPSYSMQVGGASRPSELSLAAFTRLARDLGVTLGALRQAADEVTTRAAAAWPAVLDQATRLTGPAPVYDDITRILAAESARVRAAIAPPAASPAPHGTSA